MLKSVGLVMGVFVVLADLKKNAFISCKWMTLVVNLYAFATVFSLFINIEVTIRDCIIEKKNLKHYWNSSWLTKLEGSDWNSMMITYCVQDWLFPFWVSWRLFLLLFFLLFMFLVGESSIGFTQFLCQMRCSVLEGQIICQVCISNNDLHKVKFCNLCC